MPDKRTYTLTDVAKHATEKDIWIIVDNEIYDVSEFISEHPGGKKVLLQVAGQDATKKYHLFHQPSVMKKYGPKLHVGTLSNSKENTSTHSNNSASSKLSTNAESSSSSSSPPSAKTKSKSSHESDEKSLSNSSSTSHITSDKYLGELVPYGDPNWYQGWHSPYYKPYHYKLRVSIREWVESEIMPNTHEWDEAKQMPKSIFKNMADNGYLAGVVGPPWPVEYVGSKVGGGIKPEEYDSFSELILCDELSRCGSGGVVWGLFGGLSIGLPPVMKFGSKYLKDRVVGPCLKGEKVICLAITEPYAGSDVANIQCKAEKTSDGKYYIVNGEKKWITNGVSADFFTVAVRTGGTGHSGVSLLLVEREMGGVTTRQMQCQGVWSSGTTYITFEDVKVPISNLIGKEGEGFRYIMFNFNHERWSICIQATRFARVCLEESMRYAFKRKTFGKYLIEHPVIRLKLAHMARNIEATWSLIESITYQLTQMSYQEQSISLGGPIALCKAQATTTFEYCAREASQIFGGLSYTRGGQGEKVERLYREVRAYAVKQ